MKKFDIVINGVAQTGIVANNPRLAISKATGKVWATIHKMKTGETITITTTVTRRPYTKIDIAARKKPTSDQPRQLQIGDTVWSPNGLGRITDLNGEDAEIRIYGDENRIGDVLTDENSKVIGTITKVESDRHYLAQSINGGPLRLNVGDGVTNLSRQLRVAAAAKEGAKHFPSEVESELAALGL
jgi:hypothetical protein